MSKKSSGFNRKIYRAGEIAEWENDFPAPT